MRRRLQLFLALCFVLGSSRAYGDEPFNVAVTPDKLAFLITQLYGPNGLIVDSLRVPWCTTPIEAESSLGPDSHHPVISLSGIPSAVMVLRILHPILASTLCAANPLARIAEPTIAL